MASTNMIGNSTIAADAASATDRRSNSSSHRAITVAMVAATLFRGPGAVTLAR